jgi:hypothetical protein
VKGKLCKALTERSHPWLPPFIRVCEQVVRPLREAKPNGQTNKPL